MTSRRKRFTKYVAVLTLLICTLAALFGPPGYQSYVNYREFKALLPHPIISVVPSSLLLPQTKATKEVSLGFAKFTVDTAGEIQVTSKNSTVEIRFNNAHLVFLPPTSLTQPSILYPELYGPPQLSVPRKHPDFDPRYGQDFIDAHVGKFRCSFESVRSALNATGRPPGEEPSFYSPDFFEYYGSLLMKIQFAPMGVHSIDICETPTIGAVIYSTKKRANNAHAIADIWASNGNIQMRVLALSGTEGREREIMVPILSSFYFTVDDVPYRDKQENLIQIEVTELPK
ncbi:hypothetical protein JYT83_00785 [bacterium AH-315-F18]|nr:hypothetical protein [bacterium AH-315-F18]